MAEAVPAGFFLALVDVLGAVDARESRCARAPIAVVQGPAARPIFAGRRRAVILPLAILPCNYESRLIKSNANPSREEKTFWLALIFQDDESSSVVEAVKMSIIGGGKLILRRWIAARLVCGTGFHCVSRNCILIVFYCNYIPRLLFYRDLIVIFRLWSLLILLYFNVFWLRRDLHCDSNVILVSSHFCETCSFFVNWCIYHKFLQWLEVTEGCWKQLEF